MRPAASREPVNSVQGGFPQGGRPSDALRDLIFFPASDLWDEIQLITRRVAGDLSIGVRLGKPGGGNYCDLNTRAVTLDPLDLVFRPARAKFLPGHEGAHSRVSIELKDIPLPFEEVQKLYRTLGFGFMHNAQEDGSVNDWLTSSFPGMKPPLVGEYDQLFKAENVVLGTPELTALAGRLGYTPKFVQFGSEVLRDWHQGRFSKVLDPQVEKALRRTIDSTRRAIKLIPAPDSTNRQEIQETGQARWKIMTERVWPEVQKLVEQDLTNEALRQLANAAEPSEGGGKDQDSADPQNNTEGSKDSARDQERKPKDGAQNGGKDGADSSSNEGRPGGDPEDAADERANGQSGEGREAGDGGAQEGESSEGQGQSCSSGAKSKGQSRGRSTSPAEDVAHGEDQSGTGGEEDSGENGPPSAHRGQKTSTTKSASGKPDSGVGASAKERGTSDRNSSRGSDSAQDPSHAEQASSGASANSKGQRSGQHHGQPNDQDNDHGEDLGRERRKQSGREEATSGGQLDQSRRHATRNPAIKGELSQQSRKELSAQREAAQKELAKRIAQELTGGQDELSQARSERERLERTSGAKNASKGQTPDKPGAPDGAPNTTQAKAREERATKQIQKIRADLGLSTAPGTEQEKLSPQQIEEALKRRSERDGDFPLDAQKLSEAARRELEKLFAAQSAELKKELEAKARRNLEDLEDELNQALRPQLQNDRAPSHSEQRRAAEQEQRKVAELLEKIARAERIEQALTLKRLESMTPWEQALTRIAERLDAVYTHLRQVLQPEEQPDWEHGFPSGRRLHLPTALQAETDPSKRLRVWERRDEPKKLDHVVVVLVDVSASMRQPQAKADATFDAAVFLTELFARLDIPIKVVAFSGDTSTLKEFSDSVQDASVTQAISSITSAEGGTTNDGLAIETVYPELFQHPALKKFLIVLSDAQSQDSTKLREVTQNIAADRAAALLHFGLGPDTRDNQNFYAHSFGNLVVGETVFSDSRGEFGDVLTQVITDVVLNPEKYLGTSGGTI